MPCCCFTRAADAALIRRKMLRMLPLLRAPRFDVIAAATRYTRLRYAAMMPLFTPLPATLFCC